MELLLKVESQVTEKSRRSRAQPLAAHTSNMRRTGGEEHPPGDIAAFSSDGPMNRSRDGNPGTIMRTGAFSGDLTGEPHAG